MLAYHELYAGFCALKTEKVTQTKLAWYLAWNCTCAWRDIADVTPSKNCCYCEKRKMLIVLGKKHLGNERIYRECLPNFEWKFK